MRNTFIRNTLLLLSLTTALTRPQANNSAAPAISPAPTASGNSPSPTAAPPAASAAEPNSPAPDPVETPAPTKNNSPAPSPTTAPPPNSNSNIPPSSSNSPVNSQSNNVQPSQSAATLSSSPHSSPASSGAQGQTIPGGSSQPASSVVIVTITRTGADGQVYTSVTSSYTPLPRPSSSSSNNNNSSGGSSSSGNTWAIIGGIVGGLAGIGAVVFIVFRCTQRRFSDLDDEDVAIKWPELVNRAEDPSTLNPLAARPGVGHGIGEDDADEKPRLYTHDIAMESLHSDQRHPGMNTRVIVSRFVYEDGWLLTNAGRMIRPYEADDPYLGPSAAQPPYPGSVNNLGYDEQMGYSNHNTPQQQHHDLHSQPSLGASSVGGPPHDPSTDQRAASRQHNHNTLSTADSHHQYPFAWDGPEDIPLTVVNNSNNQQHQHSHGPPTPLYNPYQKP
ncbi:uncharacterized protein VP01_1040g6 [Puccinia sorghi]|uniref:Uncharacterized protein n=1 Tax=Puccinia sorghi TaxID=27349 RepID=A0A0L6VUM8_9BASI|nr:uncharacterized protein VP01_1040g6 [Puccinia sorghi]